MPGPADSVNRWRRARGRERERSRGGILCAACGWTAWNGLRGGGAVAPAFDQGIEASDKTMDVVVQRALALDERALALHQPALPLHEGLDPVGDSSDGLGQRP